MINELLQQLGFSEKEIIIYLAILQQGKVSATNLAKITKINRTTIYSITKELKDRGVIIEDLGGTISFFVALPPTDLRQIAAREEKALLEKKKTIDKAILELQNMAGTAQYSIPKIVFISEDNLRDYLYKRTPVWNESMVKYDKIWWGFQDTTFVQQYEEWIDWYWEEGNTPGIQVRLLSNQSAESAKRKKFEQRMIRFWKGTADFTATMWVNGDYFVMIITSQHPHYLVEIHDAVLAQNMREIFKNLWDEVEGDLKVL